jgi:hypothetical protein
MMNASTLSLLRMSSSHGAAPRTLKRKGNTVDKIKLYTINSDLMSVTDGTINL